jgi:hypothetical protein
VYESSLTNLPKEVETKIKQNNRIHKKRVALKDKKFIYPPYV